MTGQAAPADLPGVAPADAEIWRDPDGAVFALSYVRDGRHRVDLPELVSFVFDRTGEEVRAIPHPPARPELIREVFEHSALPLVLQALGTEVLHASAVLAPRGVVAFCGASGMGKSTIAYGLHRRGYPLWADDAVAVQTSPTAVGVIPLPFDVRLRPAPARLFGYGARSTRLPSGRPLTPPDDREPTRLGALFVLSQASSAGPTMGRLEPSAAFAALLPHAYCFSPNDVEGKRRMLGRYLELAARLPVFRVCLADNLDTLPSALDGIEQVLAGAA